MTWSAEQLDELAQQYERIGYPAGDQWPTPPDWVKPAGILAMLRRVPDGAGLAGYLAELADPDQEAAPEVPAEYCFRGGISSRREPTWESELRHRPVGRDERHEPLGALHAYGRQMGIIRIGLSMAKM